MGCFLACFGSSKDRRRRKKKHKVQAQPRVQINSGYKNVQSSVPLVQDYPAKPSRPVEVVRGKPEEEEEEEEEEQQQQQQQSPNARKKVTFDTNVKTYEHVLLDEVTDFPKQKEEDKKKEKAEILTKSSQSECSSEHSSITSSSSSYPPNHRYQNCRESDDEGDELVTEESDLDDEDDDDGDGALDDDFDEDLDDEILGSRVRICEAQQVKEEVDGSVGEVVQPIGSNPGARDRSAYIHAVLNPVENLTQWKAVKARGAAQLKKQKENFNSDQEPRISFSLEPGFKELSFSYKSKSNDEPRKLNQEVTVDASLSSWLSSTETTPLKSSSITGSTPEKSMSQGSNSMISPEDRPILGALTLEEIKQFSASSSPRKSPTKSPDEMPIIGTVGTYWTHNVTIKNSDSATSFKGIPNTTSKYREDKTVNWHSTPFEARLERAMNRGAPEAFSTRN
ncbi:hypothetical protein SLEP1_g788 [Rubroshorea leprosula]|uniref:Uncharacterized protein n=1 Tax=Rubroshorea leprosula TaxID=152421 RepID=A0AAV5HK12_9ROSI|nr:hypothetical protein SLEP1_g788 [Rubroshorea leprosula]